jgi:hypothetical protein
VANEDRKSKTMKNEFFTLALVTMNLAACSSEGDIFPTRDRFPRPDAAFGVDAGPDVIADGKKPRDPDANCVKPGTPNNERGLGGYCERGRGDCGSEVGTSFCSADYDEIAPIAEDHWFCSTICVADDECGTGLICNQGDFGKGCSPPACILDASTSAR